MSFKLIDNHLSPAEGEVVVRTYHCTNLSPIFTLIGLKTDGYLTVTNRRVVYFAEGSSGYGAAGQSKCYSEVPLADVANLAFSNGTRFSFLRLLCGLVFVPILAGIATSLVSGTLLALKAAAGGTNPYLLRGGTFLQLTAAILLVVGSLNIPRKDISRSILAAIALLLVQTVPVPWLGLGGAQSLPSIYQTGMVIASIPLAGYWLWCLYWFVRREYLTMTISSKSGWAKPISILGVSWWGRVNVAAYLASGMAPAVDAEAMFRELGALVTDMQTMGDHGMTKWLRTEPDSIAQDVKKNLQQVAYRRTVARWVLAPIVVMGLLIGVESMWYASGVKKATALQMRSELASARQIVEKDNSIRELAPKLLALAEQETVAGEAAFEQRNFTNATVHWKAAASIYGNLPSAAVALTHAVGLQSKFKTDVKAAYLQETASERLPTTYLMKSFVALMDQHPTPNERWSFVKQSAEEARGLDVQEKWEQAAMDWRHARSNLPLATQMMRADIWVKLAEADIKKSEPATALIEAGNALEEMPECSDAAQRKELATNMITYDQWLSGEIQGGRVSATTVTELVKRFELSDNGYSIALKSIVDKARTLASQEAWAECNDQWKLALTKLPDVLLVMHMERLESEARKGNWETVSKLAGMVLLDRPDPLHVVEISRTTELKKKADGIEAAIAAESAYRQALSKALTQELASGHVNIGDMTDYMAYMDRYGQDEWAQVKDARSKAELLRANDQGTESDAEWAKALAQFPLAVQRMHAEIWVERAELEAKGANWAKVLIYAANALKEKPDHVRAKQLMDQADAIEVQRLLKTK